jgi:hypothetical protein
MKRMINSRGQTCLLAHTAQVEAIVDSKDEQIKELQQKMKEC